MGKRKKEHHEEHVDETWLIPYADMLTLLLALFIVMFAMSKVDAAKFAKVSESLNSAFMGGTSIMEAGDKGEPSILPEISSGEIEQETMNAIKAEIEKEINKGGLADKVEVNVNDAGLEIDIKDVILFDSGKADVKNNISPIISHISEWIKGLDNSIKVVGHTDNIPIHNEEFRSNWDLSAMRAINMMQYLTAYAGIPENRMSIEAYGEQKPKYDNTTPEGRAGNRRVEIIIVRKYPYDNTTTSSH